MGGCGRTPPMRTEIHLLRASAPFGPCRLRPKGGRGRNPANEVRAAKEVILCRAGTTIHRNSLQLSVGRPRRSCWFRSAISRCGPTIFLRPCSRGIVKEPLLSASVARVQGTSNHQDASGGRPSACRRGDQWARHGAGPALAWVADHGLLLSGHRPETPRVPDLAADSFLRPPSRTRKRYQGQPRG